MTKCLTIFYVDQNWDCKPPIKFSEAFDTGNEVEMVKRLKYTKDLLTTI